MLKAIAKLLAAGMIFWGGLSSERVLADDAGDTGGWEQFFRLIPSRGTVLWKRSLEGVAERANELLKAADSNGDGLLDATELEASKHPDKPPRPLSDLDREADGKLGQDELVFALLDKDQSSTLSIEEIGVGLDVAEREELRAILAPAMGRDSVLTFGGFRTQQLKVAEEGRWVLVSQTITLVVIIAAFVLGLLFLIVFIYFFRLWIQAKTTRAGISIWELLGMTFRRVNAAEIVQCKIMAVQAGLNPKEITTRALESHYLAGGRVRDVVRALIAAHKAGNIPLDWKLATAIDLAGRNVLEAVQMSVTPRIIDCPRPGSGRDSLDGVAENGIQLKVKARVTVRIALDRLIGGADEDTIIARVGEGIVSAIGSSKTHQDVLANPELISQTVLDRRLDSQTAFEIVSIDIADIDVGENIGARLQADKALADMEIARAKAESRRAAALAAEQEYRAQIELNRAGLVQAEAEVFKAMADAFYSRKLGIDDYYRLRNLQADTEMRLAIAGAGIEELHPTGSSAAVPAAVSPQPYVGAPGR